MFEKEAPIIHTLLLLMNNKQAKNDKIHNITKASRAHFTRFQTKQAMRVIGMIQMLRGYDYPERVILLDKDKNVPKGERFCFLFQNKETVKKGLNQGEVDIDGNFVNKNAREERNLQNSQNSQKSRNSQNYNTSQTRFDNFTLSQIDNFSQNTGEILAETINSEVPITQSMENLKKLLFDNYPKFVNLKMFFETTNKKVDPKKCNAKWLNGEQIDEISEDILNLNECVNGGSVEWSGLSKTWGLAMVKGSENNGEEVGSGDNHEHDTNHENDVNRENHENHENREIQETNSSDVEIIEQHEQEFESQTLLRRNQRKSVENEKSTKINENSRNISTQIVQYSESTCETETASTFDTSKEKTSENTQLPNSETTVTPKTNIFDKMSSSQFQLTTREGETLSLNSQNSKNFEKTKNEENTQVMNEPMNLPEKTSELPVSKRLKYENDENNNEKVIIGLESNTFSQVDESATLLLIGQETLCDEVTMTINDESTTKPSKSRLKPKRNFIKL